MNNYKITLLKGDGIGPEIVNQAVKVLDKAAEKFDFTVTYDEALLGGCAIDATGVPLPEETVAKCKASDSVLLGAVGGPKWDNQPGNNRPEAGLLGIRGALGLFANLRPSVIFGPLKSASPISTSASAAEKKWAVSLLPGIPSSTPFPKLSALRVWRLTSP